MPGDMLMNLLEIFVRHPDRPLPLHTMRRILVTIPIKIEKTNIRNANISVIATIPA